MTKDQKIIRAKAGLLDLAKQLGITFPPEIAALEGRDAST